MLTIDPMGRLHAIVLLAWALVRSLLAPLLGTRRGLAEFRKSYAADRLPPLTPEQRAQMSSLSGCIACGLCDLGEGASVARSAGTYAGVMDLMLASSRNMPDFDAVARSFALVGDARLEQLEARCPVQVPMRRVAAFVRAKAEELGEARRSSRPPAKA